MTAGTFTRFAMLAAALHLASCDTETPTTAVVDDAFPPVADGGDATKEVSVYKVWWTTTLFAHAVAPGAESDEERTVPANDYAYALLAPGWDPSSPAQPARLVAVRSADRLAASRGEKLHISVSDQTFMGDCAAGTPLSQADADFITQRIFPGEFSGASYDAATCVTRTATDAGSD